MLHSVMNLFNYFTHDYLVYSKIKVNKEST